MSSDQDPLPCTQLTEHEITLKPKKPINIKSYEPSECHKQVNEMLEKDIREPFDLPFNAPVLVVPKKSDGTGKMKNRCRLL